MLTDDSNFSNGGFGSEAAGPGPCWWRYDSCQIRDAVGRSYFDICTGPLQLFIEKSSQLLAKSSRRSPVPP